MNHRRDEANLTPWFIFLVKFQSPGEHVVPIETIPYPNKRVQLNPWYEADIKEKDSAPLNQSEFRIRRRY